MTDRIEIRDERSESPKEEPFLESLIQNASNNVDLFARDFPGSSPEDETRAATCRRLKRLLKKFEADEIKRQKSDLIGSRNTTASSTYDQLTSEPTNPVSWSDGDDLFNPNCTWPDEDVILDTPVVDDAKKLYPEELINQKQSMISAKIQQFDEPDLSLFNDPPYILKSTKNINDEEKCNAIRKWFKEEEKQGLADPELKKYAIFEKNTYMNVTFASRRIRCSNEAIDEVFGPKPETEPNPDDPQHPANYKLHQALIIFNLESSDCKATLGTLKATLKNPKSKADEIFKKEIEFLKAVKKKIDQQRHGKTHRAKKADEKLKLTEAMIQANSTAQPQSVGPSVSGETLSVDSHSFSQVAHGYSQQVNQMNSWGPIQSQELDASIPDDIQQYLLEFPSSSGQQTSFGTMYQVDNWDQNHHFASTSGQQMAPFPQNHLTNGIQTNSIESTWHVDPQQVNQTNDWEQVQEMEESHRHSRVDFPSTSGWQMASSLAWQNPHQHVNSAPQHLPTHSQSENLPENSNVWTSNGQQNIMPQSQYRLPADPSVHQMSHHSAPGYHSNQ